MMKRKHTYWWMMWVILFSFTALRADAMSISQEQAEVVTRNWLNSSPMSIKNVDTTTSIREIIHLQAEKL